MNIIELAREAEIGLIVKVNPHTGIRTLELYAPDSLKRFVALVRAHALEEAAGVCENTLAQHYMNQVIPTHDQALLAACADCAAAIRALKEQT